jgi:transposase InsO family protein
MKQEILKVINDGISKGVKLNRICSLLQIDQRRIHRWREREDRLADLKPGPINASHALLAHEKESILKMALNNDYVDDSHRVLAAKGSDFGLFNVSASSVYTVLREHCLTTDRVERVRNSGKSIAPQRDELDGPNQRWCWDITYCHTPVRGIFLYLFTILDEYSRKVISWRISWHMTHKEAIELLQDGLDKEGLTDIDIKMPDLVNDRGTQMKAKAFMKKCRDLGITQKFARPRTPNDNPFIESLFSIVKGSPKYPGVFADDIDAITYFTAFFDYYNNERYHGKLGFVTPMQKHNGLDKKIISERKRRLSNARKNRIKVNKQKLENTCICNVEEVF